MGSKIQKTHNSSCPDVVLNILFKLDHKKFHFPQGDAMGIHARITWLHKKLYFKDCNIFLDLSPCDPAKPDKSVKKSAEKLVEFIHNKMNLDNQHKGMTFTSDCAIYKGVIPAMENLGIDLKLNHF